MKSPINSTTTLTESSTTNTITDNNSISTEFNQVIVLIIFSVGFVSVITLMITFATINIKSGEKNEKNTNKKSK